jgi:hypothetical protein
MRQANKLNKEERAEAIKSLFRPAVVTSSDDSPAGAAEKLIERVRG